MLIKLTTGGQFQQHFMHAFFIWNFCRELLSYDILAPKMRFCTKNARIKCWWNCHQRFRIIFAGFPKNIKKYCSECLGSAKWSLTFQRFRDFKKVENPLCSQYCKNLYMPFLILVSRCQFHQHFTYEFFIQTSFQKLFYVHVSCRNNIRKKNARVECTWNWH